ncbi:hypothetical protein [Streptococcus pantholopis]|uniref:Uncharacterized protein n=1 Tax=Streptococcus pantholopis TaxID=1811193 RepID=A0A172Q585_9STRE|nr:hypothetical protein [Streptococcus pantholopis]AND78617.1 hypothetical protein A0O21_00540 [Streptococcus pantholopis]
MSKKSNKKGMTFFQGVLTAAMLTGLVYSMATKEKRQALSDKSKKMFKDIMPDHHCKSEKAADSNAVQATLAGLAASAAKAVNDVYEKAASKNKKADQAPFVSDIKDSSSQEEVSSEDANR